MSLSDMILGDKGFLVSLRCDNSFDEECFESIKEYLTEHISGWKAEGVIPVVCAVALFDLIEELAGGNRFWSEEVALRVEDALLEVQDILHEMEE